MPAFKRPSPRKLTTPKRTYRLPAPSDRTAALEPAGRAPRRVGPPVLRPWEAVVMFES
jgi:hypothetical protein